MNLNFYKAAECPDRAEKPRRITRKMLTLAKINGWNAMQAAEELGFAHESIRQAATREGIDLHYGQRGTGIGRDKVNAAAKADDTRIKAFSASPAAIARAIQAHGVRA